MARVWLKVGSLASVSKIFLRNCRDRQLLQKNGVRLMSSRASFKASDVEIDFCSPSQLRPKPAVKDLVFGVSYTDHMLEIEWTEADGWGKPKISPFHYLNMHPGAKVLHYACELCCLQLFEGMKAYRTCSGKIAMFRPDMNMQRMIRTAERACLPTFDADELIILLKKLVAIDQEWVPHTESSSLYIRPVIISHEEVLKVEQPRKALLYVLLLPTGPYYTTGYNPVSLLADPQYVRAWPGGCGDSKMGSNYAPTLAIQKEAMKAGHSQVLWLFGPEQRITEAGAMNIMIFLDKGNGERELVTPPLDGLILPGVTRASLLELARSWREFEVNERDITMGELLEHSRNNRILEVFSCGTAAVVCPVGQICYKGKTIRIPTLEHERPLTTRMFDAISDIQYGRTIHPWSVPVE
ncbi:Branched-chain amino acid aminotransferase II [Trinorchestia longiramus]|nr:Branched-chain amino acid aminotransferase II [Trinorchestia longiramus]